MINKFKFCGASNKKFEALFLKKSYFSLKIYLQTSIFHYTLTHDLKSSEFFFYTNDLQQV